jgi:hypothetical protein
MHVIGHQYVRMDSTAVLGARFLQALTVKRIILLSKESHTAVVPTLDDVLGLSR